MKIILNPLGKEFCTVTLTKFEFLYQCLAYPDVTSLDAEEMFQPMSKDVSQKVDLVLKFLKDVARVHAISLIKIKDVFNEYPEVDWEKHYRYHFCVNSHLILERIIESHLKHLHQSHRDQYYEKRDAYKQILINYYEMFGSSWNADNYLKEYF